MQRLKDEADEEKRLKKWKWMGLVYSMSRGDITKRDQILNMNFISVLNWMAYEKEHPDVYKFYNARN